MTPIRHVLGLDNDAPICLGCVVALGGKPIHDVESATRRVCEHCGRSRICFVVDEFTWPATRGLGAPRTAVGPLPTQDSPPGENGRHASPEPQETATQREGPP